MTETSSDLREHDGDEWVEVAPTSRLGRRIAIVLAVLFVLGAVAATAGWLWLQRQLDPPGDPGEVVMLEIPPGTSTQEIGDLLAAEDVITSSFIWREWYLRTNDVGPFEAGFYELRKRSSMDEAAAVLAAGPLPPPFVNVTVPEGFTVKEIVARLADPDRGVERFDAARIEELLASGEVRSKYQPPHEPSMEGMLFPDTYRIEDEEDELAVLTRMVARLDAVLDELDAPAAQERFNLSPYEIVVVASLIEEETRVDAERPKVAQVIYNRLRQGIPLGIDATSRYEAELAGRSRDDIDFESDSPYNTRRNAGLPPTPIAAPGRASIEAALNPEDGPWIYYVLADEEGNHFFTDSASEFARAKEECRQKGLGCG